MTTPADLAKFADDLRRSARICSTQPTTGQAVYTILVSETGLGMLTELAEIARQSEGDSHHEPQT